MPEQHTTREATGRAGPGADHGPLDGRRPGARPGRHAAVYGLAASLLLHALLLLLNPGFRIEPPPAQPAAPATAPEFGRLVPLADPRPAGAVAAEPQPVTTPTRTTPGPPGAPEAAATPAEPGAAPGMTPGERLRYRPGEVWRPMERRPETIEECRERQLAQRIEEGIADESYGVAPPPTVDGNVPVRGFGVRIPFGRKRPPPPQVVPAPLPDSLRRYSLKNAERPLPGEGTPAFFAPGCFSDTTQRMLPRLRSDTTR